MRDVFIIGVGMTRFAKHFDLSVKDLAKEALDATVADANIPKEDIEAVWFSNSGWGGYSGQTSIRGQVALRGAGIMGIPITNVENACAGGATALNGAWLGVTSGVYECTLAIGAEKMYQKDKAKTFRGFWGGTDVEAMQEYMAGFMKAAEALRHVAPKEDSDPEGAGKNRSVFMDFYSLGARAHIAQYGTTQEQLAIISSKNHFHSSLNPYAQFQKEMSVEEVLAARTVSWPLTVPMCAPVGDGAAAAILCSADYLKKLDSPRPVKILASILGSSTDRSPGEWDKGISVRLSRQAYEKAAVGPEDINLAEVHDATAFGELSQTEALGFCEPGEGGAFAESGATRLGGTLPINTSGGLESRGHPIGASGLGMNHELVTQLRHEAGSRQVENCRLALAENGGGTLGIEEAAMGIHILERVGK
jgi:acetyl-CoA acyltransferase